MSLQQQFNEIVADQAPEWSDMLLELILPDESRLDEARLIMAPVQLERTAGRREHFTFRISRQRGYGAHVPLAEDCLKRLDDAGLRGELSLSRVVHGARHNWTQGPGFWDDHAGGTPVSRAD